MSNKELKVGPGMVVAYKYKLYNVADKSLLFETPQDAPDMMVYGVSQEVVPGLIATLKDMKAGDRFEVELPPEAAFGQRYPENVVKLEKEIFMRDGKLVDEVVEGAMLPMMTAEGFRVQGRVLRISDKEVEMDFNHPFAGLTVRFDGEICDVREATPEELKPTEGCCGCGGGCHDSEDGCGCGGGCKGEGETCGCGDSCDCK